MPRGAQVTLHLRCAICAAHIFEASIAEGYAFEDLDFVITALCEAVGIAAIERVEYVFRPVAQYSYQILKLRKLRCGIGYSKELKPSPCLGAVW